MSKSKNDLSKHNLLLDYPELAKEWDYEKNQPAVPEQYTKGSHEKVYWKCPKGHPSYPAQIAKAIPHRKNSVE